MPKQQKPELNEIAAVEKDIFMDYIGKTLLNPDKVLKSESGGKGIELYSDLLRDAKVGSALQTRRLAVTGREWEVIPASDKRQDAKIADYVKEVLMAINLDAYRRSALSGLILGFKPCEIMWDYSEGDIFISKIIPRASRRFVFDLKSNLRLLTPQNMLEGEEVPEKKFQLFTNPSDDGTPYGDGLGRILYWPVWFKKNAIKFWMIFADKFGSPTAIGKYPPGTSREQQQDLLSAIEAIQQESAVKIPNTMVIELLEAARQGTVNTYETLCNFMDRQIAQALLGHTGTSESTPGKLGSEDAANEVRKDYIKSDADLLCESENNQMIRWIVDYNFPPPFNSPLNKGGSRGIYPKVWIRTEPEEDLMPLAERDKILAVDIGVPIGKKYFYDTYGIPKPEEGEELIVIPQPSNLNPVIASGARQSLFSEKCSCGKHHTHDFAEDEWISKYMDALGPSLKDAKKSALDEVEAWLKSQSAPPSADEFAARVHEILGANFNIDAKAVESVVAGIYTVQKLAGAAGIGFGGADIRVVNFLSQLDNFYVSKFIQNPDVVNAVKQFLNEQYLENGAGLFGRTADSSIQAFKTLLDQKVGELADYQVRRIVDTAVQRTRNWAHISQMNDAGIAEIEVIEPTQDCDFCKKMHGKIISVNTAYSRMTDLAGMSPEEYQSQFTDTGNQPTLDNLESFVSSGALPPYHPHCHGRIIKRVRK